MLILVYHFLTQTRINMKKDDLAEWWDARLGSSLPDYKVLTNDKLRTIISDIPGPAAAAFQPTTAVHVQPVIITTQVHGLHVQWRAFVKNTDLC